MQKLLELQEQNIKDLEEFYERLKIVTVEEFTRKLLDRKLKVVMTLWDKIYDANTTMMESTDFSFQITHEEIVSNKYDEAFSIFDASVVLIFSYLDLLGTQSSIQSIQISEVVRIIEQGRQNSSSVTENENHLQINEKIPDSTTSRDSPLQSNKEIFSIKPSMDSSAIWVKSTNQQPQNPLDQVRNNLSNSHRIATVALLRFNLRLLTWWPIKRNGLGETVNNSIIKKHRRFSQTFKQFHQTQSSSQPSYLSIQQ